jgi:L-iditol 2-dehydrogenase
MKAIVYYGPGDIRVEELPVPPCGDDELLVQVDACAVCGTDLKSHRHGNPRIRAPLLMGHEFTGRVEEAGRTVDGFATGDRIVMATSISCGSCYYCRRGWTNLCVDLAPMGFSYPGGMAERVVIPARGIQGGHVVRAPPDLKAEHAALAEPLSCAINGLENCGVREGDVVVVLGAGPMGLMNVCVARSLKARTIILSEVSSRRRAMAEPFGCDLVVDPAEQDLAECVREATDGLGADAVIVAAPAPQPQQMALDLVRKRGTVCLFASLPVEQKTISLDSRSIHYGELRLVGTSDSTPQHVRKAIELLGSGRIPAEALVSHVLPLGEIFQAFDLMIRGEALRVVLRP